MTKKIPKIEYTHQWEYSLNDYPSHWVYFQSFYGDTDNSLKYMNPPATKTECQLAVLMYLSMFQRYRSQFVFESIERERARDLLLFIRSLFTWDQGNVSDEAIMVFWYHFHKFGLLGQAFNRTTEHFMEKYDENNDNENKKAE